MDLGLPEIVRDIAASIERIDARRPQAANARTGALYQPGIGPLPETQAVALIAEELQVLAPESYAGRVVLGVSYPGESRQKCDLCIGPPSNWEWAVEVKLLRLMGDNGKPNDNMLMHILSPYKEHRSAVTDCRKLSESSLPGRKAIVIYGFDHPDRPMDPAIDAFEVLAGSKTPLSPRTVAYFENLVHPVHQQGRVLGWELGSLSH